MQQVSNQSASSSVESLIYEDTSRYDFWIKLTLLLILAVTLVPAFALLFEDVMASLIMFGATLFDALLFWVVLPQRFQIFESRLRIVMGYPFAINISISNINYARKTSGYKALAYGGLRFATSTKFVVEIARKRGMGLLLSPASGEMFVEQLNYAMQLSQKMREPSI